MTGTVIESKGAEIGSSHPEGKNAESEYDVVLKKVSHYFGSLQVLKDVSLAVIRGEFFGILGPAVRVKPLSCVSSVVLRSQAADRSICRMNSWAGVLRIDAM